MHLTRLVPAMAFRLRSSALLLLGVPVVLGLLSREPTPWWEVLAGAAAAQAGLTLRLASIRRIGKAARVRRCKPRDLVSQGTFRWLRNPLYVANLTLLAGLSLCAGAGPIPIAASLIGGLLFYTLVVVHEERRLTEVFGQAYLDYCAAVPRWLPRPWRLPPRQDEPRVPWSEVLRRERALLPGAILGFVGILVAKTWIVPRLAWLDVAPVVGVMLVAAVVHGADSERKRIGHERRHQEALQRSASAER